MPNSILNNWREKEAAAGAWYRSVSNLVWIKCHVISQTVFGHSVVDPDPVGYEILGRIRLKIREKSFRIRIRTRNEFEINLLWQSYKIQQVLYFRNKKVRVCRATLLRRRLIHTFQAGSETGSGSDPKQYGKQCCGFVTFWYGSGSAYPYHWLTVRIRIRTRLWILLFLPVADKMLVDG